MLPDRDIETFIVRSHRMISQPNIFLHQILDIRRDVLVILPSGIKQDTPDDTCRPVSMFLDLLQVTMQIVNDLAKLLMQGGQLLPRFRRQDIFLFF